MPPPRGLIRFVAMLDENVALNGKTLAHSLDEEAHGNGSMGVIDEEQPASFARRKRLSVKVGRGLQPTRGCLLLTEDDSLSPTSRRRLWLAS